jgi:hypothetical protein
MSEPKQRREAEPSSSVIPELDELAEEAKAWLALVERLTPRRERVSETREVVSRSKRRSSAPPPPVSGTASIAPPSSRRGGGGEEPLG